MLAQVISIELSFYKLHIHNCRNHSTTQYLSLLLVFSCYTKFVYFPIWCSWLSLQLSWCIFNFESHNVWAWDLRVEDGLGPPGNLLLIMVLPIQILLLWFMVQMSVCGTVRLEKGPREGAAERKEPGNLFDHHRRISPKHPSPSSCFAKVTDWRSRSVVFC